VSSPPTHSRRPKAAAITPSVTEGEKQSSEDVAVICGLSPDGEGVNIIRKRGERVEAGTVRRLEEGKPIHGELVQLQPRPGQPLVCDVEVKLAAPSQLREAHNAGPAQVATESYRKNWDAIYKRKGRKPSLLN
jgi:hypothetical protein